MELKAAKGPQNLPNHRVTFTFTFSPICASFLHINAAGTANAFVCLVAFFADSTTVNHQLGYFFNHLIANLRQLYCQNRCPKALNAPLFPGPTPPSSRSGRSSFSPLTSENGCALPQVMVQWFFFLTMVRSLLLSP